MFVRARLALFLIGALCWGSVAQRNPGQAVSGYLRSQIPGEWRGHSECVDKSSPCNDETNIYRFSKSVRNPNQFTVTASKVVDGKEIVMGSGEWKFDDSKRVLTSETPIIRLVVSSDQMVGALTLPSGAVYRRIYLRKAS